MERKEGAKSRSSPRQVAFRPPPSDAARGSSCTGRPASQRVTLTQNEIAARKRARTEEAHQPRPARFATTLYAMHASHSALIP